jgi:hypothetical protein
MSGDGGQLRPSVDADPVVDFGWGTAAEPGAELVVERSGDFFGDCPGQDG